MKKVCLFILLSLYFATGCAGFDLQTAIPLVETKTLPLDFNRELAFRANHCLDNPNNAIPDKMYENFQLTDSFSTRDNTDTMLNLCFKCKLGSDLYLCLVRIGGVIEPVTYVLTSVDYNYRVVQSLEVGVKYANTYIKQFRITDNREVYVYRLVPTSTASVSLTRSSRLRPTLLKQSIPLTAQGNSYWHRLRSAFPAPAHSHVMSLKI